MDLSCFAIISSAANSNPIPTTPGSVLTDGTYTVSGRIIVAATDLGQSGLEIAPGATVTIIFEKDSLLAVKAGAASGRFGAGAGIHVPEGYKLAIYLGSQKVAEGDNKSVSYTHGELKSDLNYSVKVIDANGKVQKDSNGNELSKDGGKITCNAGFFQKLIAFFKGLFKSLPKVEVKPQ